MLFPSFVVTFVLDTNHVPTEGCGVPVVEPRLVDARILGGIEAIPGSWPWTVGLYGADGSSPISSQLFKDRDAYNCAGALIDEQTVVTAAHCLAGMAPVNVGIMLGAHDRVKQEAGHEIANASKLCIHPDWVRGKKNDIGLVRLGRKIHFSRLIQAVCLSSTLPLVKADDDLFVTGWGITSPFDEEASSVLKQARQSIIARNLCEKFGRTELDSIICASHEGGSTCKGDSGGPLVLRVNQKWFLEGIVSAGPAFCGAVMSPLYYTQISAYREWISLFTKNSSEEGLCL